MADNYTSAVTIGGNYTGTMSVSGPVLLGENIVSNGGDTPVLVIGNGTIAGADAKYSIIGGQFARTDSPSAFVWNGDENYTQSNPYRGADTPGTFSISPSGGLSGFYVGNESMHAYMKELSGSIKSQMGVVGDSDINNLVHTNGDELIDGKKTFNGSLVVGNSDSNNVTISKSSIYLTSENNGGVFFHYAGAPLSVTSSITEPQPGSLVVGANMSVTGNTSFTSTSNQFEGMKLNGGGIADFTGGSLFLPTPVKGNNSSLAATTEYVDRAVSDISSGTVLAANGNYTGNNTYNGNTIFAGSVSVSQKNPAVEVDFTKASLYVATKASNAEETSAANLKFVKDMTASLSASLRGNKTKIGSSIVPLYLNGTSASNASLVQFTSNVGNESVPIYMKGGSLTATTKTIGDSNSPVYLNGGSLTQCNTFVNLNYQQDVSGSKSFTSNTWHKNRALVYNETEKGSADSYNKYTSVEFMLSSLHNDNDTKNYRIGLVGTWVESSGRYTQTYLSAYSNTLGSDVNTKLGIRISPDGKEHYAYAPQPTDTNGSRLDVNSTSSDVIPTIGWANQYLARKDGTTFTGDVSFNGALVTTNGVQVRNSGAANIDFYINGSTSRTARIRQNSGDKKLVIIPCDSNSENTTSNSAANICLGTQSIGSSIQPIYLNGGIITKSTATVGSNVVPVYMDGGVIKQTTTGVGNDLVPIYLKGGSLTATARSVGSETQPIYLNAGSLASCKVAFVNTSTEQSISGVKTFSGHTNLTGGASLGGSKQLVRNAAQSSYYNGRNVAMIRHGVSGLSNSLYYPFLSAKTANGTWDMATHLNDCLKMTYISDSKYASGSNVVDGQMIFEPNKYRTVTSMPLGFHTFCGEIGSNGNEKIDIGSIPYVGGTPTNVKITVINCGNVAYNASIGSNDASIPAHSSISYSYTYNASSSYKLYLQNASLSANVMLY